ncbi:MAG TPA: oligosaccharide flippase family protein [Isosphaeraceae bacterium]|nr:oligosaccharide flippase family protein [Isosphaeraceae bacterium]
MAQTCELIEADRQPFSVCEREIKSRFLSGAFWSLSGAVVSRGMTLVGFICSSRLLGADGLGELGIVQSTTSMFAVAAGMGLGLTATKYIAENRDRAPELAGRYIRFFTWMTAASGLMLSALYVLSLPAILRVVPSSRGLAGALLASTGLLFLGAMNATQVGILTGLEAFRASALANMIRGSLAAILLVAGVAWRGVLGGVVGLIAAEVGGFLAMYLAIRRRAGGLGIEVAWGGIAALCPALWRFSLPALAGSLATLPAMWVANVILVREGGGFGQVGIYVAANKWGQFILFVPSSISVIVLPMLSNRHGAGDRDQFRDLLRLNVVVNTGLTFLLAVACIALSRILMGLYGSEYAQGWPVLAILAAGTLPQVLNNVLGQALVSTGDVWRRGAVDLLLAATLLVIAWWLVPWQGAIGMAAAFALAYTVASVVLGFLLCCGSLGQS